MLCPICLVRCAMIGQDCCNAKMCVPCTRRVMRKRDSTCPFCRAQERERDDPDLINIRRRRTSDPDGAWRPAPGLRILPRSGVRHTRRTVYIYDYEEDEEAVAVDSEQEEEPLVFPTMEQLYPTTFIPPPPPSIDLTCDEDEGVEESKEQESAFTDAEESKEEDGVEESKEQENPRAPDIFGPCIRCNRTTTRSSSCCACYYCWPCWFGDLAEKGIYNIAIDRFVHCQQCGERVHVDGKRINGGPWV